MSRSLVGQSRRGDGKFGFGRVVADDATADARVAMLDDSGSDLGDDSAVDDGMNDERIEAQVDTKIAALYPPHHKAVAALQRLQQMPQHQRDRYRGEYHPDTHSYETYTDAVMKAEAEVDVTREAVLEAEKEYDGWSRFFMVAGGHIHESMNCSTCNKGGQATQFGWLPDLSGLSEADAVEAHGGILCTVCYPSAPTEWTEGENKKDAADKALNEFARAINKTPEGKKVKSKRNLVDSKVRRLDSMRDAVGRSEKVLAQDGFDFEIAEGMEEAAAADLERRKRLAQSTIERLGKDMPKTEKQLAKAQAQLDEAEAALDAMLADL